MAVRIADLPEGDRPRERLRRVGLAGLSDAELIALVVRSGGPGRSALDIGRQLLADQGSVSAIGAAQVDELARLGSIGTAKACAVAAAFELGRRALTAHDLPRRVSGPEHVVRLVTPLVSDQQREQVFVVVLTTRNYVRGVERLTSGTVDRAIVAVRDVIGTVLRLGGVGFSLAHTHPSGDPAPSAEDVGVTRDLAVAATATGLLFADHVIVAGRRWASMRTLGHLSGV